MGCMTGFPLYLSPHYWMQLAMSLASGHWEMVTELMGSLLPHCTATQLVGILCQEVTSLLLLDQVLHTFTVLQPWPHQQFCCFPMSTGIAASCPSFFNGEEVEIFPTPHPTSHLWLHILYNIITLTTVLKDSVTLKLWGGSTRQRMDRLQIPKARVKF